jgi:hypothetical protein
MGATHSTSAAFGDVSGAVSASTCTDQPQKKSNKTRQAKLANRRTNHAKQTDKQITPSKETNKSRQANRRTNHAKQTQITIRPKRRSFKAPAISNH